jgi:hypothetical protein
MEAKLNQVFGVWALILCTGCHSDKKIKYTCLSKVFLMNNWKIKTAVSQNTPKYRCVWWHKLVS